MEIGSNRFSHVGSDHNSLRSKARPGIEEHYKQHGKLYYLFHKKAITKELLEKLQQIQISQLSNQPLSEQQQKVIDASKYFLKNVLDKQSAFFNSSRETFSQNLLAARLKIPVAAFAENPGLYDCLIKNSLVRPLCDFYKHPVTYDSEAKEVLLLMNGRMTSLDDISDKWMRSAAGSKLTCNHEGLCIQQPNEILPIGVLPKEKWPEKPQMELVTQDLSHGGHAWIRLIDTEGKVYSFGLYQKASDTSVRSLLSTYEGVIRSPDPFEFCSHIPTVSHTIDLESDQSIVAVMHTLSELSTKGLKYSMLDKNCADFAVQLFNSYAKEGDRVKGRIGIHELPGKWKLLAGVAFHFRRFLGMGKSAIKSDIEDEKNQKVTIPKKEKFTFSYPQRITQWINSKYSEKKTAHLANRLEPVRVDK